jgi:hypothetical protein
MNMLARMNQFSKDKALRPISENPRYREAAEKLAKFQSELRELRAAIDRENATWYAKQSSSIDEDAVDRADKMLAGDLADDRDTQTKLAALEEKIRIIRPAIARQQEVVNQIRGELSVAACRTLQDRHRKALLGILQAARQLAEAAAAERTIRAELLNNGSEALDAFVPAPKFGIPLAMGGEDLCSSPLWHYRRQLEDLEILP